MGLVAAYDIVRERVDVFANGFTNVLVGDMVSW